MRPKIFSYLNLSRVYQSKYPYMSKIIPGLGSVLHPREYFVPIQSRPVARNYDMVVNDPAENDLVKVDEKPLEESKDMNSAPESKALEKKGLGETIVDKTVPPVFLPIKISRREVTALRKRSKRSSSSPSGKSPATKRKRKVKHRLKIK